MKGRNIIRKIVVAVAWSIAGMGMVVLLVAANRKQQGFLCSDVKIDIKGDGDKYFIDKNEIMNMVIAAAGGNIINKPVHQLNVGRLEHFLERGKWIRDAELYFDSRNILHVAVTEREPVARVFTTNGMSFYIDSSGQQMPLLETETARVLVITNYTGAKKYNARDSAMAADVKNIASVINSDEFWKEQIAQVDIMPDGSYEAIPLVGDHIIKFGSADQFREKLNRLYIFYTQVLSKVGIDKYATIDVQYKGQVVGILKGTNSYIDSVQLQRNIEELLNRSKQQMMDDSAAALAIQLADINSHDSLRQTPARADTIVQRDTGRKSAPVNSGNCIPKPKAVMGKIKNDKPKQ